ncbi:MAG: hypothetical protein PHQ60_07035 [Sideroxydans sp.]|nr:hypothetical protein [Sideroxydans sp.]
MNSRIRQILDQISALEDELQQAVQEQRSHLRYQLEGKRVVFEQAIKDAHRRVKQGVFRWFISIRPQNFLTMPVIYGMAIPLLAFDLFVSVYQLICFPIYGIARVKRAKYFVMDHRHLAYLNFFEKGHCMYCSYAVGLLAYANEIIARTEQYFCPIKHAGKILGTHARYEHFLEYGEAENYHGKLEAFRSELGEEERQDVNF